jgi:hypothetical protein
LTGRGKEAHSRRSLERYDSTGEEAVMPDPQVPPLETPEEVLESEIRELEKRTLNSGWLWVAAAVGLIVLFSAAFLFTSWDRNQLLARPFTIVPEAMVLKEPRGQVDRDLTFRWNRVDGATSYILVVTARDGDEVELLRPVHENFLKPTETEVANFNPGSYSWTVEARSAKGQLVGFGQGSFTISVGD